MRAPSLVQVQVLPAMRVFVLGPFRLERRISLPQAPALFTVVEGKALGDRPGVMLALLKALLSCENRYATKAWLAETLWPEVAEDSSQRSLRAAKHELSKILRKPEGTSLLCETPDGLGLYLAAQADLEVDADVFASAVQEASRMEHTVPPEQVLFLWKRAYELRTGAYLPGDVGVDWTEPRRLELETLFGLCVQRLALTYRMSGYLSEAERILRTYWATHLIDEEVLFQLMELVAAQGRPLTALRFYQISVQALREELAVAPCEQLRLLAEQIRTQRISASVALTGIQQNPDASYRLSWDGLLLPASTFMSSEMALQGADSPTVLGEQTARLMQAIMRWHGRAVSCDHLQGVLHQELGRWNTMDTSNHELLMSRRTALATLVAMPLTLVPAILAGQRSPLVLEEFLPECTASLTACWHLLMGDGLATVATQLPKYLPALEMLAQQPSRYQKTAAHLAAQGHLLMSLVALHNLNVPLREAHCWRAERYGKESSDQVLYVTVLLFLACMLYEETNLDKSLYFYEKAIAIISHPDSQASPLLKNKVFVNAAAAYAQAGRVQEALRCLGKAHEFFPKEAHDEPVYVSTDHGEYGMLEWEGLTYRNLGKFSFDLPKRSRVLYKAAQASFAQVSRLEPAIVVPERLRLEIINDQAATALALDDMESFQTYFQAGAQGAKVLGSEKRKQEAVANWKLARLRWPHEMVIKDLADMLL